MVRYLILIKRSAAQQLFTACSPHVREKLEEIPVLKEGSPHAQPVPEVVGAIFTEQWRVFDEPILGHSCLVCTSQRACRQAVHEYPVKHMKVGIVAPGWLTVAEALNADGLVVELEGRMDIN